MSEEAKKKVNDKSWMLGKVFKCDEEEFEVVEILLYGYRCIAISLNTGQPEQFYCDNVEKWINRYKEEEEREKVKAREITTDNSHSKYLEKDKHELIEIIQNLEIQLEQEKSKEKNRLTKDECEKWKKRCLEAEDTLSKIVALIDTHGLAHKE